MDWMKRLMLACVVLAAFTGGYAQHVSVRDTFQPAEERPYAALKTNLLFDAASLLNVEVEVPFARRWSVVGEWMFPWWLLDRKQHCLEILSGHLEVRHWIGKRKCNPPYHPLTGWFVGVYGGTGLYDVEWDKKGYQGEGFLSAGISAGYVHRLSREWRMEFSLSAGYMNTDYKEYDAMYSNVDNKWHLIWQRDGSYSWLGPTKAKVSLVWYPHFRKKGGSR